MRHVYVPLKVGFSVLSSTQGHDFHFISVFFASGKLKSKNLRYYNGFS